MSETQDGTQPTNFTLPQPQLQVDFSVALAEMRSLCLQEALSTTVAGMDITVIDRELASLVPKKGLAAIASRGLRGELVFSVPSVLKANPHMLGYYRLLLGFSQKSFYGADCCLGRFKNMELKGNMSESAAGFLEPLCKGLIACALELIDGVGAERISRELLDDLTLLTLGPQLRGGANVKKGSEGIITVFGIIHEIVKPAVRDLDPNCITIDNAAGRKVLIEFAPDPDLIIREEMSADNFRNVIAIEVKAGQDYSNIHNRIGEAEKSHQKARANGFTECWTVVNVGHLEMDMARQESPSTNRFYKLADLQAREGKEYADFQNRIVGLTGIPNPKGK
jgi:hypothetical protein